MSNAWLRKQREQQDEIIKKYYETLTPDKYKEGIENAIRLTEKRLSAEYEKSLVDMEERFNKAITEGILIAMDTLATEMIYELGNVLECYVDEPEYLDQKVDIIQGIYETAMTSIEDYATNKYKTDKHAQREFKRKKQLIQKYFGMSQDKDKNDKKGDKK